MFDREESFDGFARSIAKSNGLPLVTAERYAALIGDTPEMADGEGGLVVVRDERGRELARVKVPGC